MIWLDRNKLIFSRTIVHLGQLMAFLTPNYISSILISSSSSLVTWMIVVWKLIWIVIYPYKCP